MLRWRYLLRIVAFSFTLTSCHSPNDAPAQAGVFATPTVTSTTIPAATLETAGAFPPQSCPVTRSQEPLFTPPPPYPPTPPPLYAGESWFGTPMLWTMLRADGTWEKLPYTNGSYVQKTFWWREGYDVQKEPTPNLLVTGRRLDAPAPPLVSSRATNGSRGDIGSFMIVGVNLPTPGCWEITGQIAGTELRYIVRVAP